MNPFRSATGHHYTKSLFLEESYSDTSNVLYTLKDVDHRGYKSLYRLYMDMADVTEILFAESYLDGMDHWNTLTELSWFKPYVNRWRKELHLKIKALAFQRLREIAADETNKACFSANRLLLEGGWIDKELNGVGRPTKEKIREEAEKLFEQDKTYASDLERLKAAN